MRQIRNMTYQKDSKKVLLARPKLYNKMQETSAQIMAEIQACSQIKLFLSKRRG